MVMQLKGGPGHPNRDPIGERKAQKPMVLILFNTQRIRQRRIQAGQMWMMGRRIHCRGHVSHLQTFVVTYSPQSVLQMVSVFNDSIGKSHS